MTRSHALLACWLVMVGAFHSMSSLDIPSDPAGPFMVRFVVAALAWAVACVLVWTRRGEGRRVAAGILVGGVLLRLVAWNVPILLETDIHRYLWDGFVVADGGNPYRFSPQEVMRAQDESVEGLYSEAAHERLVHLALAARHPRIAGHLSQVNHPEIPTCYPPLAELAFGLAARLSPGSQAAWKSLVVVLDLVICGLLVLLLRALGRDPAWVIFYAWAPLPIKEYANTGHFDPLATLFTLAAVLALVRRRGALGGALLGLGIASKVYPLVLIPTLWRRLGARGVVLALAVPWLVLLPFADAGLHVFDGLLAFARDWEFNSSLFALTAALLVRIGIPEYRLTTYWKLAQGEAAVPVGDWLLEVTLDDFLLSKVCVGLVLVVVLAAIARWEEDADWAVPGRALMAIAALLLLAPVCDPWYLPWLMPYAAVFPSPAWLYLGGSMVCYYSYFLEWRYLPWHRPVEYLPFYALLCWSLRRGVVQHLASFEEPPEEPIPEAGCDDATDSARPSA